MALGSDMMFSSVPMLNIVCQPVHPMKLSHVHASRFASLWGGWMLKREPAKLGVRRIDTRSADDFPTFPIESLYREHWHPLCSYLRRRFGAGPPEPEDIAQSAFIRLAGRLEAQSVRDPIPYLYRIAHNLAVNDFKRQIRIDTAGTLDAASYRLESTPSQSPAEILESQQRLSVIGRAIKALPEKQKVILLRSRLRNETFSEISAATGWSRADISRQLARALAALQDAIDEAEHGQG